MIERQGPTRSADNSVDRRERISDEQMGNLLAAFGNHEAKALTLVLMRSNTIYTMRDLSRMIRQAQGDRAVWRMGSSGPFQYCSQSLAPIGLVAREIIDEDLAIYGYEKTEYGKVTGDVLAALLLDYSLHHDLSLYQVFGATVSKGDDQEIDVEGKKTEFRKRSPITRLKIFSELLRANLPTRNIDLSRKINEKNLHTHLRDLSNCGVINYYAKPLDEPSQFYRFSKDTDMPISKTRKDLNMRVYDLIRSEPEKFWSSKEIVDVLSRSMHISGRDMAGFRKKIRGVISFFLKQGYIDRMKPKDRATIYLTENTASQLRDLLEIIHAFQNQDPEILEKGRNLAFRFRAGEMKKEVARLMEKARVNSTWANRLPVRETSSIMISVLQQFPSRTTGELRSIIEKDYGRNLSYASVARLLRGLKDKGLVLLEKRRKNHWKSAS